MLNKDASFRNVSNLQLSKECYKKLKMISIDKEISLQEVAAEYLEKAMSKKGKQEDVTA